MLRDDILPFLLHFDILQEEVSRMSFLQNANELKEELRARILEIESLARRGESLTRTSSYEEVNICSPHICAKWI
ncbi:MAG: hypothetical protein Q4B28_04900 [bacterium]|nr:hypothetical protein [bacterium]